MSITVLSVCVCVCVGSHTEDIAYTIYASVAVSARINENDVLARVLRHKGSVLI